jgi:hypothetical protein
MRVKAGTDLGVNAVIRKILAATACAAMLAGCEAKYQAVTPDLQANMLLDLKAGKPTLDCAAKCSFTWAAQVPAIHQLDLAEKWNDLAIKVMTIGYGSDLAYYYLGQAAQGLGYQQAAIDYYNLSLALNSGPDPMLRCNGGTALAAQLQVNTGDPCQGVDLPGSIPVLIQASKDAIAQQAAAAAAAAPPPPVHHRHHTQPASATNTGGTGWVAPPPPASTPAASNTGGTGWVAPPPPPASQ